MELNSCFLLSPCSCIRNALMLTAVATNSLKIVIFSHLMLVDANCNDSVTIPRCPNLVVDLKVSECGTEKKLSRGYTRILGTPYFKSWIHSCRYKQSGISWLKLLYSASYSACSHKEKGTVNQEKIRASRARWRRSEHVWRQLRTSQVQAALRLDSSAGREADTGKATYCKIHFKQQCALIPFGSHVLSSESPPPPPPPSPFFLLSLYACDFGICAES